MADSNNSFFDKESDFGKMIKDLEQPKPVAESNVDKIQQYSKDLKVVKPDRSVISKAEKDAAPISRNDISQIGAKVNIAQVSSQDAKVLRAAVQTDFRQVTKLIDKQNTVIAKIKTRQDTSFKAIDKTLGKIKENITSLQNQINSLSSKTAAVTETVKQQQRDAGDDTPIGKKRPQSSIYKKAGRYVGNTLRRGEFYHVGRELYTAGRTAWWAASGAASFLARHPLAMVAMGAAYGLNEIGKANKDRQDRAGITDDDTQPEIEKKLKADTHRRKEEYREKLREENKRAIDAEREKEKAPKPRTPFSGRMNLGGHKLSKEEEDDDIAMRGKPGPNSVNIGSPGLGSKPLSFQTMYDRQRIDEQKAEFLKFGRLPSGFEFSPGYMGTLGSPRNVAAGGAMPLGGMGRLGGRGAPGYGGRSPGGYTPPSSYSPPATPAAPSPGPGGTVPVVPTPRAAPPGSPAAPSRVGMPVPSAPGFYPSAAGPSIAPSGFNPGDAAAAGTWKQRSDIPYNGIPAAIRYNNPGAAWPSSHDDKYGIQGFGLLKDGENNRIGRFPTPAHGLAANMDLYSRNYTGLTLQAATSKWRGRSSPAPSFTLSDGTKINGSTVITPDMAKNKEFMTKLFQSYFKHESGAKGGGLTPDVVNNGFDMYRAGGIEGYKTLLQQNQKPEKAAGPYGSMFGYDSSNPVSGGILRPESKLSLGDYNNLRTELGNIGGPELPNNFTPVTGMSPAMKLGGPEASGKTAIVLPGIAQPSGMRYDPRGHLDRESATNYFKATGHDNVHVIDIAAGAGTGQGKAAYDKIMETAKNTTGQITVSGFSGGAGTLRSIWGQLPPDVRARINVDLQGKYGPSGIRQDHFPGAAGFTDTGDPKSGHMNGYKARLQALEAERARDGGVSPAAPPAPKIDGVSGAPAGPDVMGGVDPRNVPREMNLNRPQAYDSRITVGDKTADFRVGSRSDPRYPSAPYGAFSLLPHHSAVGPINVNPLGATRQTSIPDPKTEGIAGRPEGAMRAGVLLHSSRGPNLTYTMGCLGIRAKDMPAVEQKIRQMWKEHGLGNVVLVNGPHGAEVLSKEQFNIKYPQTKMTTEAEVQAAGRQRGFPGDKGIGPPVPGGKGRETLEGEGQTPLDSGSDAKPLPEPGDGKTVTIDPKRPPGTPPEPGKGPTVTVDPSNPWGSPSKPTTSPYNPLNWLQKIYGGDSKAPTNPMARKDGLQNIIQSGSYNPETDHLPTEPQGRPSGKNGMAWNYLEDPRDRMPPLPAIPDALTAMQANPMSASPVTPNPPPSTGPFNMPDPGSGVPSMVLPAPGTPGGPTEAPPPPPAAPAAAPASPSEGTPPPKEGGDTPAAPAAAPSAPATPGGESPGGGDFPTNNPETQPESPGSSGMGAEARCFV